MTVMKIILLNIEDVQGYYAGLLDRPWQEMDLVVVVLAVLLMLGAALMQGSYND